MTDSQRFTLQAVSWKMEQAAAQVRLRLRRGLDSIHTISATAFLLSMFECARLFFWCFRGYSGSTEAIRQRLLCDILLAMAPLPAGLAIALVAFAISRTLERRLEEFELEMKNGASETISYLSRALLRFEGA